MATNSDLKYIKKHYGEKFAHFCRSAFPTILEHEGVLTEIISTCFDANRELYDDIIKNNKQNEFKDFVYSKFRRFVISRSPNKPQNPFELMKKAGYKLYQCNNNQEVLSFKKYWAKGEELCTFDDLQRINTHYIFFAVKDGAEKLRREDFKNPLRQDAYGTSVISLQFTKGEWQHLSIKNRYNHVVINPDATFSNDLENIIAGLTDAFSWKFNFAVTQENSTFDLPGYVTDVNGKFYRRNLHVGGIFYCPNNITIRNGVATQWDKNIYEVMDCYILNTQTKELATIIQGRDPFAKQLRDIEKVDIISNKADGTRDVIIKTAEGTQVITLNARNEIVGYYNPYIERLENCFMLHNKKLKVFSVPNVKWIGSQVLMHNQDLEILETPEVTEIEGYFLSSNTSLTELSLPNVKRIGPKMLYVNKTIQSINVPQVKYIGANVLFSNQMARKVVLPNAINVGAWFLNANRKVTVYSNILNPLMDSRFKPLSALEASKQQETSTKEETTTSWNF